MGTIRGNGRGYEGEEGPKCIVVVYMRMFPQRFRHVSTWSAVGGAVWGKVSMCGLDRGSLSLGVGTELRDSHHFQFTVTPLWMWWKM